MATSTLPPDVLRVIFSFFPMRFRVRSLFLVCKSWRLAALATITELPYDLKGKKVIPEPLLASLTTLSISGQLDHPPAVPLHLLSLEMKRPCEALSGYLPCPLRYLLAITTLTSIDVRTHTECSHVIPLLQSAGASLRTLRFGHLSPSSATRLNEMHFPLLSSFEFAGADYADVAGLVTRHSESLTSLALTNGKLFQPFRELAAQRLPNVKTLRLEAPEIASQTLAAILACMPALTDLHLAAPAVVLVELPELLSSLLVSFRMPLVEPKWMQSNTAVRLASCTHLTSLSPISSAAMLDRLLQSPIAGTLEEVALVDAAFKLPLPCLLLNALRKVTNLRVLHLTDVFPPWMPAGFFTAPAEFALPNRVLTWNLHHAVPSSYKATDMLDALRSYVFHSTQLRTVELRLPAAFTSPEDEVALQALIHEADRKCVDYMRVHCVFGNQVNTVQRFGRACNWTSVSTEFYGL